VKSVKIGIAGLGGQGKKHFLNCLRLKNCELVAVADSYKRNLLRVSELGIKTYNDYHEMIPKEKPDAVIIALPNYLHADCSKIASENGCNILLEKPFARNIEEAKLITDHVRKTGVKLMLAMCQRFIGSCQKLKEEIDNETLGRIDFASALFFTGPFTSGKGVPEWIFDPIKMGGGALLDSGCHLIDLLLWFFGEVDSVHGHTESIFDLGYDDYADVLLRFRNGVNALAVVSWRSRIPCYRIEVAGEHSRKVALSKKFGIFDVGLRKALLSFVRENVSQKVMRGRPFLPLGDDIYYNELDYFTKCIINDEEPEPNAKDGLKVLSVIESIYEKTNSKN
jgi:predicted dehydrogenase